MTDKEATEISLFVRTSNDEVVEGDRRRIVDALVLEADLDEETAGEISREVERQVFASGIVTLTAPLIRELVNAKLIERGFEEARRLHTRIGFPLYDIGRLIVSRNKENANVPHRPEGTNLTLAEGVKREYALHSVFSRAVAEAHLSGDIHLHKLGHIDRPYCSSVSLEYVKKFGLSLPGSSSAAKPARHADVLLAHMVRFSAVLQGNFAASLEWDAVNFSFAPYLAGRSDAEVGQLAQRLVYEFSQLAFAKGGQTMFTDINLYWDMPPHLQGSPVIGPGGEPTGKGFADYRADAGRFLAQFPAEMETQLLAPPPGASEASRNVWGTALRASSEAPMIVGRIRIPRVSDPERMHEPNCKKTTKSPRPKRPKTMEGTPARQFTPIRMTLTSGPCLAFSVR